MKTRRFQAALAPAQAATIFCELARSATSVIPRSWVRREADESVRCVKFERERRFVAAWADIKGRFDGVTAPYYNSIIFIF
jgi:hypothetical protein